LKALAEEARRVLPQSKGGAPLTPVNKADFELWCDVEVRRRQGMTVRAACKDLIPQYGIKTAADLEKLRKRYRDTGKRLQYWQRRLGVCP
jgi:hypothetical protein